MSATVNMHESHPGLRQIGRLSLLVSLADLRIARKLTLHCLPQLALAIT